MLYRKNLRKQIHGCGCRQQNVLETPDKLCMNKLAKSIAVFGKTELILHHKSLCILYYTPVLQYQNYRMEVLGNSYKSKLQPLFTFHQRVIRIVRNV